MEKVSVIINNYNYADYIESAVDSVLAQSYDNYELIIVDDGSTDHSRDIIEKYAAMYNHIIPVFKENGGQTSAFNAGMEYVSGDIIAFLDSDDYWYKNKLKKIVEKHKEFPIVQHYLSNNGNGIYREIDCSVDWQKIFLTYGYLYAHAPTSALSFRTEILKKFFPLKNDDKLRYCSDGLVVMLALTMGKVGFIEDVLGFYRIHGNNLFINRTDNLQKGAEIIKARELYLNEILVSRNCAPINFQKEQYYKDLIKEQFNLGNINLQNRCWIWGTEFAGKYFTDALNEMGFQIEGYIDSNVGKSGMSFMGRQIFPPDRLQEIIDDKSKIIIASSAVKAIASQMDNMGYSDKYLKFNI